MNTHNPKMDSNVWNCACCGSYRAVEYRSLRKELKERKTKMKRELELLERDLACLKEVAMKSDRARRLFDSSLDEFYKHEDEDKADKMEDEDKAPDLYEDLEELEMERKDAEELYLSSLREVREAMSKIKIRLGGADEGESKGLVISIF